MKVEWRGILFLYMIHSVSGHYIFSTLFTSSESSTAAIRKPVENAPVNDITSPGVVCNVGLSPATETVTVAAGSTIGFKLEQGKTIYHKGPAAMYLGRAPGKAADWDGSGSSWFKIAEWGATFNPFDFIPFGKDSFNATIPSSVPSGEYLVRIEQWGLHNPRSPEVFVSCGQIKITGGGTGSPTMVSIPGYIAKDDPMLMLDIYWPIPTAYTVPGPAVYSDTSNPAPVQTQPHEPDIPTDGATPPAVSSGTAPVPTPTTDQPSQSTEPYPTPTGGQTSPDEEPDPAVSSDNAPVPTQTTDQPPQPTKTPDKPPCPQAGQRHKSVQKLSIRHFSRRRHR